MGSQVITVDSLICAASAPLYVILCISHHHRMVIHQELIRQYQVEWPRIIDQLRAGLRSMRYVSRSPIKTSMDKLASSEGRVIVLALDDGRAALMHSDFAHPATESMN